MDVPGLPQESGEDSKPNTETVTGSIDIRSVALTGLFILGIFYTLYFARPVLLPIALALLISFLLAPIVEKLERLHIKPAIGAAMVLLMFIAILWSAGYALSRPAANWIARAPEMTRQLSEKVKQIRNPLDRMNKAAEKVSQIAKGGGDGPQTPEVKVQQSIVSLTMLGSVQEVAGQIVVIFILVYFLLASDDFFLRKLVHVLPRLSDKKRAAKIATEMEHEISRYFLTVTTINAGLGLAIGTALLAIGMPNPYLWGGLAFVLNFVPYLGAFVGIVLTGLVALISFESLGHALLVPAAYLAIATLEGSFITPMVLGRRFTLNPVVIFIWLIFWGWMWSIPGALLAVPMLSLLKIFCDHIDRLHTLGEFLGG